ncbi:MAG: serine/threonine-protein kinase [Myxococcota bacterium]
MTTAVLPDEIGPYRVLRPLARGGMAEVYEVVDRASGEHLALKLLVQTGGALPRFNREYEAMIRLNHPNIVRVYAYGVLGRSPWLSMELIDGTPVQAYAKRWGKPGSPMRMEQVVRVTHDVALALDHIHHRGLVHRDLKSANVLVLPDGRVKLLDFGTAKVSDAVEDITRDGEFIGTFAYASPEQLLNRPVDGRSDLYSLGVLLYRLATGRRPFEADDVAELARMHVRVPPPPPSTVTPDISPALEQLILALLEKAPESRPQTGAEVADALERASSTPMALPGMLEIDLATDRLVGREEQLRTLWRFFAGMGSGDTDEPGQRPADLALIVGQQGSGRHELVHWVERDLVARSWSAVTLFFRRGAQDLDQIAAMLIELAHSFGPEATEAVIEAEAAIHAVEKSAFHSVEERIEVLRIAGADLVRERCAFDEAPLLVLVRGLQHAGPVGFEALAALRDQIRLYPSPVLLLADCTVEVDEPGSLCRASLPDALRVSLPTMNERQVALVVGGLLHRRPPPAAVARKIHAVSGGLPSYIEEVVKNLVAGGLLRARGRDQNRLEWAQQHVDLVEIPVPTGARERVLGEFARLPTDRRRCLEALALCGGEATVDVLAGAVQWTPAQLGPALDELVHHKWVTVSQWRDAPYVKLTAPLAEQVVLSQVQPCRRRLLERLIIEQVADEPAFVAQIRLLLAVGRVEDALLRARDWTIHHLSKHRAVSALEVLDFVVPVLEDAPVAADLKAQLYLLDATSLIGARPADPRTGRSLNAAKRFSATGDVLEAETLFIESQIQQMIGHFPNFRKKLNEAWQLVENLDPMPLTSAIASMLGWSNRLDGNVEEAATWHGRARRIALQAGAQVAGANASVGVAEWQLASGLLVESERTLAATLPILAESSDLRGLATGLALATETLWQQGRFSEAFHLLNGQLPAMRECEVPSYYVRLLLAAASAEVGIGRLGRAQEWVDELAATLRRGEYLELRLRSDLVWGRIQVASGLAQDALPLLRGVEERARTAKLSVMAASAAALAGEASWALGDARGAITLFRGSVSALQQAGDIPALAAACECQARAMCESVDPDLVFRPIADWLDAEPAAVTRIERQIARGRYLMSMGRTSAEDAFESAQRLIEELAVPLEQTDAAALRLHPWTRHIRRARKVGRG